MVNLNEGGMCIMGMGNVYCYYGRSVLRSCWLYQAVYTGLGARSDHYSTCIMKEAGRCQETTN